MLDFPRWKAIGVWLVCAFFMLAALPNMVPDSIAQKLPFKESVPLGLDLRGGSYLLLEVDNKAYQRDHIHMIRDELRVALRKAKVGYRDLRAGADAVTLRIRSETVGADVDLKKIYRSIDPDLEITESGGVTRFAYSDKAKALQQAHLLEQSIEIVNRRIDETGTKEPIIQRQGGERIIVQVPGLQDPAELKRLLGKTAKMSFHLVNEGLAIDAYNTGNVPIGTQLLEADGDEMDYNGQKLRYPVFSEVALSGELLTGATATYQNGVPVVSFQFNRLGAQKFASITQKNIGKRFAVVLDNKVITAPVIRGAIPGGSGIIEGNFTVESADELAKLLRAGALPAPLNIIEERSVGPSLGQDSIDAGTAAAVLGTVLVIIFMFLAYGFFGLIANLGLLVHLVMILGTMSLLGATLTLPGIAGIVLTLGMAVDANVLIFERMRDELRFGKSALGAIESGFRLAYGTIFDSNITTLIAAALLYYFGSGPVKGFAVTLSIGLLSTLFASVMFTRMIIIYWVKKTKPKTIPI